MAGLPTVKAIRKALETSTYYGLLRVPNDVSPEALQQAFHHFALEYHPDRYVQESRDMANLASDIFKRGAEAFAILSDPAARKLYDDGLTRGHVRYIEGEAAKAAEAAKPKVKTLEQVATKPKAKDLAKRADRLLVAGKVEEARVLLTDAVQDDYDNAELKARLVELFTMGGYESLSDVKERVARPSLELAVAPVVGPVARSVPPGAGGSVHPPGAKSVAPSAARSNATPAGSAPPGPPPPQSLESIATTPKAKELARKADRLLVAKKFEEARVVLTDAVQDDFENTELKARLDALYTAGGYEKL